MRGAHTRYVCLYSTEGTDLNESSLSGQSGVEQFVADGTASPVDWPLMKQLQTPPAVAAGVWGDRFA